MLSDAIQEIETAERQARAERSRRELDREALTRAETYAVQLEDMLEDGVAAVPEPVFVEIRRFVRMHSRRMGRKLAGERPPDPSFTLDILFDLEETLQDRRGSLVLADAASA